MTTPICILGTDTGIGKTYTCCQLLQYLISFNRTAIGLKPIASGIELTDHGYLNEDVYSLWSHSKPRIEFKEINSFSFTPAIAPHIAAKLEGVELKVNTIIPAVQLVLDKYINCDHILIEGVGGLMVPLNPEETFLDLVKAWQFPVVLVVGMRLGCLNHALLSYQMLIHHGVSVVGWIANRVSAEMKYYSENLAYLKNTINVPLLAEIPFGGAINPTPKFSLVFKEQS